MVTFYIAQNTQTTDNADGILSGRRNPLLSSFGYQEADELARKIIDHHLNFSKIHCGPSRASLCAANTISEELDMPKPLVLSNLVEKERGEATGYLKEVLLVCRKNFSGGETWTQLVDRVSGVLEGLIFHYKKKSGNVLLVCEWDIAQLLQALFYLEAGKDKYKISEEKIHRRFFGGSNLLVLCHEDSSEKMIRL